MFWINVFKYIINLSFMARGKGGLPFAYFLENKKTFLESLRQRAKTELPPQQRLLTLLQDEIDQGRNGSADSAGSAGNADSAESNVREQALLNWHGGHLPSVTVQKMMAASMHLGHDTSRWNPKMKPFILGSRGGIHILNLDKTIVSLRIAAAVTEEISRRRGVIVMLGTREPLRRLVYECAVQGEAFYVNQRWIPGTLSNAEQVLGKGLAYGGGLTSAYTGGTIKPDLLIVLDYANSKNAVEEAERVAVPTIAICDTDCDPERVTYPVPANDNAYASVEFVARTLARSAQEGRRKQQQAGSDPVQRVIDSSLSFIESTNMRKHEVSTI